ncbi:MULTISPECIES: PLxRFG domain-containing protein [Aeromonas]|uniref:PLxRFG domain-containing protein n=1 Tax=Aeromonas TaxID=642 RepID=UPI0022DF1837|nr:MULTISPECIES: PLxRFG domain-containing protein [Aeromonas]WEA31721.1 PLxRFG domain-containing protein [Aeromonas hydrophila]
MAETNEFDAYWDDKLSQRNLEVGGIDVAKGIAGAAVKGTGSLISNLSAGDIARGARGLVDPTMNKVEEGGVIDTALTWLNDTFDPEGKERQRVSERVKELQDSGSLPKGDGQNKDLTVAALPGLSALAEPLKGAEVIGDIADKAIKPTAKFIGEPIKEVGQGIIESTSPDMQEAMSNPELFKGGQLGRGAGDPAAWAGVAAQAVGSLIPTVATAAITKNPTAGLGVGMGMSVGQAGDGAYETAINSNPMDLIDSPIFVGELKKVSQDPEFAELDGAAKVEEAQRRYAELSSSMAKSKPETIAAAAMGTMLGDATIVKTMLGSGAGGAVRGMLKGAATEAPGEFGEEWLQQYVGNTTQNQMASKQLVEPMAGTLDAGLHGAAGGVMAGGAMGGAAAKFAKVLHANKDNLTPEQAVEVVERSMKNRGVDDATARQVAEQAAGMMTSPDLEAAVDGLADPPQASSDQNPLGPSASQFDELRDVPAYLRQDDTADRYKGMAADSEVQRALAGEFGQTVQELVASQMKAGDQGKSLYERAQAGELGLDPFAGNKSAQQVAMENQRLALPLKDVIFAGDANAKPKGEAVAAPGDHDDQQAGPGPQFRGGERTSWQSGQEGDVLPPEASSTKPAGELPGAVIEGEAREVGNELPHRNVVYGNDLRAEQQRAADLARRERELNNQPLQIGQSETIFAGGTPGADPRNSAYTPPRLSRDQVDTSMGEQSTRDPRSPVAQSIEQAGSATDSVFGPLQSLRITKRGKPFGSEKEAAMASRKGKEMPVPLNGGGFGVAEIAEVEQVKAAATTQSSAPQLDDISVTDPNQPSDQPAASVSAETVPAPSATAGEASQLVPAIDTGYREVIPVNQPQTEVSNEPVTPVPAISSEGQRDQPGAGEPAAAGIGTASAGLTKRTGTGDPTGLPPALPAPDGQQQNDPTLTAPATDAGASVSGVAQPEPVAPEPAAAPTPWAEAIDNPDGTITLKGEVPAIKQWAKESGVKAIPGKGGLVVAKSFTAKVRGLTAPAANEPSALVEAARGGVVPEPTEVDLIDRDLLKEHAGRWKYRSAVGAGWFTSNTKEGAIDRAREAYRRAFEKGDPVPTREERWEQSEREFAGRMDNRFGGMTINELEKRHQNLGGTIADLQLAGRHEMNGNGGRRTGAAVANEGARQAGQEKMDLERYIQLRREREEMAGSAPTRMIEEARAEVAPVDASTLADDEAIAVADELGLEHGDNPDDARWRLDGVKPQVLADTVDRVRNPSQPAKFERSKDNPNIVAAPPVEGEPETRPNRVRMSQQRVAAVGEQAGLTADEVAGIVSDFRAEYKGARSLDFIVGQTQEDLYGPEGSPEQIGWSDGGYLPGKQQVHLFADSITRRAGRLGQDIHQGDGGEGGVSGDPVLDQSFRPASRDEQGVGGAERAKAEVVTTLRHEVLGHYGLDTFTPSDKEALLQKLIDAKQEKWIAPVWQQIAGDSFYGKQSALHQAEEVFAHLAERALPSRSIQAWNDIKTLLSRLLRKVGLVKGPIREHELDSLIKAVGKGIRSGERSRQNIRGDKEVIGKQADEPAKDDKPERIIRFSKQAMAQGDKPATHLTSKEAELVTKEWFKQYRGASGIDVQIHATQAELEKALGLAAQDGLIRRAAFDDDSGTLHVAADTIANPKRMREILRHEVLAHYGLANVLGDGEYTKLMSRLIQSQKDPSMKPVWDWVNTHYADEDIGTQAEEVVAHLAEVEQGAWGRGWDRVVAWVTRALRAVGFVPDGITAAETRSLIEGLGKKLKRSGPDDNGPDGDKKFSQEVDLPTEISQDSVGKTLDVSGVERPTINHDGQPIHQTEEGLRNFWRWFGNSLMRDGAGNPVVVYHATESDITAFNTRDAVENQSFYYGEDNGREKDAGGFFFTPDKTLANDYAENRPNANIIPVYLKLNNPVYLDEMSLEEQGNYLREARANGHDGAIIGDGLEYVVFTPEQIKSAIGNNGEYSKSNPDVRFSQTNTAADDSKTLEQSIKQKAVYQAGAALSSVKNWLKQGRPLMLGTLTDLQIDQVYRDITGGAVSQYQRLRTQMEADRNDILLDAETRIDPLWDALGKQEKADLSNLMHDATMARLHPDKSLDENSYYLEAKQKVERAKKPETKAAYEAELHIIERNHSELARQYNALPANAKALYDTMQDTYTKQWESLRGAIEQRLEDLLGVNQGRAMAAEMRQKMEHALQHGPYFPLTRYGDYVVKARKGDEYVREHFERRADAEQAVKQYQRDGYNAVMTVKEEGGGDSANANQLGMEMLSFLDSADGVSKSALKDEIWQAMLRMMPDASYAKHAIHRRRVKGASRDAHRAYLNSVYHYARHVSKIRYGHKMQGELDKLSEQIRAGVAGEPSSLKPEDLEIAQQVLNEMNKRHDLNMNPTGKAWAGSAGNIGFLYYIGPSVASAVVNMTQNFTVMLPQLGAKYGFAKSAAAMTQALGDYVKHGKFKAGTTEAWHSLTRSTTLPADERAILDRLYRAGALDLTQAHSIAAKADTDQQDAKPMGKRWRRAMRWAGATFHNAEVLNREVAALAAYRLLKQAEPTLNGQQYADRVAEMVYDGHGNYAASNRPRYMRNDITKVLTQFKIYSQMMTYVIYSNAIKAAKAGSLKAWKKGVLGKELTQDDLRAIADGKLAAKTLGGVLATHWVMAGVMGLPTPLTFAAYAIAAGLDDDDDRSGEASFRLALTEALGPRAGELLAKGPMDALTNLSIAGRTGLGDLWWRSPKEGTEGDDLAWHAVQQLLGPVAGIGINLARGTGQMTDGHIQRGLETMLPKSIRDVAKSYRQATEGEQTIKGDIIMDDVATWNVAMQGLGFGSAQMAKNYDAREYIKGKEKRIADKRSQLLTDYYMARKSGEMDEVQEVLERIKMFNAIHHPRERITGKSLALSFKSKLRSNERTQGGVYLNRNREYLREEGRFAD